MLTVIINYVYIRNRFTELLLPLISLGFELVLRTVLYSDLRVVDQKYGQFRVDKSYEISLIRKGLYLQVESVMPATVVSSFPSDAACLCLRC